MCLFPVLFLTVMSIKLCEFECEEILNSSCRTSGTAGINHGGPAVVWPQGGVCVPERSREQSRGVTSDAEVLESQKQTAGFPKENKVNLRTEREKRETLVKREQTQQHVPDVELLSQTPSCVKCLRPKTHTYPRRLFRRRWR